jgi:hypothetical protein
MLHGLIKEDSHPFFVRLTPPEDLEDSFHVRDWGEGLAIVELSLCENASKPLELLLFDQDRPNLYCFIVSLHPSYLSAPFHGIAGWVIFFLTKFLELSINWPF